MSWEGEEAGVLAESGERSVKVTEEGSRGVECVCATGEAGRTRVILKNGVEIFLFAVIKRSFRLYDRQNIVQTESAQKIFAPKNLLFSFPQ